ncbi:MAG: helix-turn-helix domain-containing protein [Candidatus Lokiarchaeota archaeon]|nr:helix-turn-helix domain-containing protein [Candidatus Lokiarchaeota archaeon]
MSEYLNSKEAAQILGVVENTLKTWRYKKTHNIPYYKIANRVKYKKDDLIEFMEKNRIENVGKDKELN